MLRPVVRLLAAWTLLTGAERTLQPLIAPGDTRALNRPPAQDPRQPEKVGDTASAAEPNPREHKPGKAWPPLERADAPVLLAALGLLSTGAATLTVATYYAELGVSLDEVGVGIPRLVVLGSTTVLWLGGVCGLTFGAAGVVDGVLARKTWSKDARAWAALVVGALALVALVGLSFLSLFFQAMFLLAGLATLLLPFLGWQPYGHHGNALVPLGMTMVSGVIVWGLVWSFSGFNAQGLREGERPGRSDLLLYQDQLAVPTCVYDTSGRAVPDLPPETVLLGTNGDVHVLLVQGEQSVVHRVASQGVSLRSREWGESCPPPRA